MILNQRRKVLRFFFNETEVCVEERMWEFLKKKIIGSYFLLWSMC